MTCRKIAILVEAGKSIGGGHLQRMKCLASQQEIDCQAILTQTPEQVAPICRNRSLLSGAYSAQLSALVHQHPDVEVLVIDPPYSAEDPSYRDGDNWHEFIVKANQHGLKTVFFTDEDKPSAHIADALVNDHPQASDFHAAYQSSFVSACSSSSVPEKKDIRMLLGISNFLIEPVDQILGEHPSDIFVNFGAFDQLDALPKFADALEKLSQTFDVFVAGPGAESLKLHEGQGRRHQQFENLPREAFLRNLARASFCMTAAGNVLYERAHFNVPGISISQSDHQETLGISFQSLGLTHHLGKASALEGHDLAEAIKQILDDREALSRQRSNCAYYDMHVGTRDIVELVSTV